MPTNKIGRFDVLSEITHSEIGAVYKASDPESGQTVALKTIKLELLGEQAPALVKLVQEEADGSKGLNSHNIAALYGAGEMDAQLVACVEYVQGNSIGTMLARKEGFSIWDLQDIARQCCQGLDHARVHNVVHFSLEPAKIMVQWDGVVKMLGYGISSMGAYSAQASGTAPEVLHYMSPEQLRGDPVDGRSNLFTLGAILYEMVTERRAFEGTDADAVRQTIAEMTPVAPEQINRKVHPVLNQVIMKAIAKAPEDRYQSGQELVNDLERCKESAAKAAVKPAAQPPKGLNIPNAAPAAAAPTPAAPPPPMVAKTTQAVQSFAVSAPVSASAPEEPMQASAEVPIEPAPAKAAAAAAGAGWMAMGANPTIANEPKTPKLDPSAQFIGSCVKASVDALIEEQTARANMSSASVAEAPAEKPKVHVDPMMDESRNSGPAVRSFSEIDELPPLKEAYVPPPPPPPSTPEPKAPPEQHLFISSAEPEKPKVQPREVAKKAVTEIKKTPPKLFMYSIAAAIGVILLVITAIAFHIRSENADDDSGPVQSAPANPVATAPAPAPAPQAGQASTEVQVAPGPGADERSRVSVKPKYNNSKKKAPAPVAVPVIIPGQLTINSTPEGAQVHIDGKNDPGWITPYNLTGLAPGQHSVTVSKPGYGTETRTLEVASGGKSFLVIQLAALAATVSVGGEPSGASIFLDGKDTGHLTPSQISVDKTGNHTLLVRKQGYLDETTTANLQSGQTFRFAPTLRPLGNTTDIKAVGKLKKMFGGGGDTAAMGTVSVKTTPKGAQIVVNNRVLDKGSPADFYLNPGTYVVDITLSGYKSVQRVVNVDKGGKVAIDETLVRE